MTITTTTFDPDSPLQQAILEFVQDVCPKAREFDPATIWYAYNYATGHRCTRVPLSAFVAVAAGHRDERALLPRLEAALRGFDLAAVISPAAVARVTHGKPPVASVAALARELGVSRVTAQVVYDLHGDAGNPSPAAERVMSGTYTAPEGTTPLLSGELIACHGCGEPTDINLLDGKDDGTGDFTILHCEKCYGPGWRPMALIPARRRSATCCTSA